MTRADSSAPAFSGPPGTAVRVFGPRIPPVLAGALALLTLVLVGLLLIPVFLLAAAIVLVAVVVWRIRAFVDRARRPNGALDGRRNVRVVVPGDDPARPT